jgi:hypothetical protein
MLNQLHQTTGLAGHHVNTRFRCNPVENLIFTYAVKRWKKTTMRELLKRNVYHPNGGFQCGIAKDAELAFYIMTNVDGVTADTECLIGKHWKGRAIRIGDTEYRHQIGLLYEQKI